VTNLKLATYNVENLFDLNNNGSEYDEYIPNTQSNWNKNTYKIKLENISKVIKELNADIIALQEVESLQALKDLKLILKKKGLYYPFYKIANKKNTTIKVAVLSKIPFVYTKEISITSSKKYRNILEIKLNINNNELYLFINHWKSKSAPESKRIISAKALRNRIKEIGLNKNIILLGDFNSDYEENKKFIHKRKFNDTNGKTGINNVLRSYKQTTRLSKITPKQYNFYNLWYDTTIDHRWSYIFRGKKEALDNILVSQSLLNKKNIYYKESTINAYKPQYLLKKRTLYRWSISRKKPYKHKGKGYSDHLAVSANFIIQ
jgi:endonuclease/exonuclease/phosphatase family metal-dependent hydrolase